MQFRGAEYRVYEVHCRDQQARVGQLEVLRNPRLSSFRQCGVWAPGQRSHNFGSRDGRVGVRRISGRKLSV